MNPQQLNTLLKQHKLWRKGCQFLSSQQKLALLGGDQSVYQIVSAKLNTVVNQNIAHPTDSLSKEIEAITLELMDKYLHNLGWKFEWKRMTSVYGQCFYSKKKITLSYDFNILGNRERKMIVNTILHEIAHALVGPNHNHDDVWRQKAIEIGCDGLRIHNDVTIEKRYIVHCNTCNRDYQRSNKPSYQTSCGMCSNKFDSRFILVYTNNPNYKRNKK
jgi:predicted SprT family Zn-dependent metalloprotease